MTYATEMQIQCSACGNGFAFTMEEQEFYESKGFQPPRKCKPCRDIAKLSRNGGGSGERSRRQMYPATCASCGVQTQVPFEPNGSKPVYCRDCFQSA